MGKSFSGAVVLGGNFSDEEIERIKSEWNKQQFYSTSSSEIKVIPLYQDRAIDLLRRMTKDDPFIEGDTGKACYFCGDTVSHFPDCPYLLAKQLLEEIDNAKS